ncbi:MAG: pyruvate, phosphate dikinase [bacterium]
MPKKYVYSFGGGKADGNEGMKNLLGGKGANLAEMAGHESLKLPVPPGFTITTEVCTYFYQNKRKYPSELNAQIDKSLASVEKLMKRKFGDSKNPLLVSVRSGARKSMPGMMDTVLNVGLTTETIPGLIEQSGDERFVYDAYRRLIMMYADVVMEKAEGIEPKDGKGIRRLLDELMDEAKKKKGVKEDTELDGQDLKLLAEKFKQKIKNVLGKEFPDNARDQLWGAIAAVFLSWNGARAISYRRIENIPDDWGTAVNVQTMVFGNMGDDSATGVAFTRDPGNGEKKFYGEYLINAQGEDVVAGLRTPAPVNEVSKSDHNAKLVSLEKSMPKLYKELHSIQARLEKHYKDMMDIEFTIEKGTLYMLQCRVGKRNGIAAVKMAVDMASEKLISKEIAVSRVTPAQLDELLHPIVDPKAEKKCKPLGKGLPAGPGGADGMIVFTSNDAVTWKKNGKKVILVRDETSPEDVEGMRAAEAILTARGGMTSHAALVARGWGKCCIVGCGDISINYKTKSLSINGKMLKEGDWITLNGTKGVFYEGQLPMIAVSTENKTLNDFLKMCDGIKKLKIRTNADTPEDAARARSFGAEGIGLFRTEHMFYGEGAEKPLFKLRKMIVSNTLEERNKALTDLYPHVKDDIKGTLEAMDGLPVTIRLLDPPLHEFVPHQKDALIELAKSLNISLADLEKRADTLRENNPMMGHRGVRLGITYPEVTKMQVRAIFEAAAELMQEGKKVHPEIMIPVVCSEKEFDDQNILVKEVYAEVLAKYKLKKITHMVGTMIEIPRAAFHADKIAQNAEFFSFGTNDLTQMTFGFSRDDIGGFLPAYLEKNILSDDPFQTIDIHAVGELMKIAIERGRKTRPNLKVGICGEHGGEARSVAFCHSIDMDYASCSPFRIPIARLAAAQAELNSREKNKKTTVVAKKNCKTKAAKGI